MRRIYTIKDFFSSEIVRLVFKARVGKVYYIVLLLLESFIFLIDGFLDLSSCGGFNRMDH